MSNIEKETTKDLVIAFARELIELTGESPSRLHKWGEDSGLSVLRARQTFFSHVESRGWERSSIAASTEDFPRSTSPLKCQLRLRAVSLVMQFSRDKRAGKKRHLIVLIGYEVCSHLIHFQVYRGAEVEVQKHEEIHGIEPCEMLPVATVAAFVEKCGQMVGLPLQRVLLTQKLMDFPPVGDKVARISLALRKITLKEREDGADDDEVLCNLDSDEPYVTQVGNHPFIEWCGMTSAAKLTAELSNLVNRHNRATALSHLEKARDVLNSLRKKSLDIARARHGASSWPMPLPAFLSRLNKHTYASEPRVVSVRKVGSYRGAYEDFDSDPGDRARVA